MSEQIKKAIKKIAVLREELKTDLAEIPNLVIRADHTLETLSNGLLHIIGESPTNQSSTFTPTPITHVLGDDVTQQEKVDLKAITPTNADKEALKKQATEAYDTFLDRDSNVILESVDDLIIRAVAKKAGMDVTSTNPEKITVEFIESIKEAISNTINKIVELQQATNEKTGKEFTEADEKEIREHFQNATIENMEAVVKEMEAELKAEPAKKEEAPAPTTTTPKSTNKRR